MGDLQRSHTCLSGRQLFYQGYEDKLKSDSVDSSRISSNRTRRFDLAYYAAARNSVLHERQRRALLATLSHLMRLKYQKGMIAYANKCMLT